MQNYIVQQIGSPIDQSRKGKPEIQMTHYKALENIQGWFTTYNEGVCVAVHIGRMLKFTVFFKSRSLEYYSTTSCRNMFPKYVKEKGGQHLNLITQSVEIKIKVGQDLSVDLRVIDLVPYVD